MAKNKMKSHRGACKRFKLTGSGKVKRNKAYKGHILTKKTAKRKRRLRKATVLTSAEYRRLWIARINAAARLNDISYSKLMNGLRVAGIEINRKMLSEMAIYDAAGFTKLCEVAKTNLK